MAYVSRDLGYTVGYERLNASIGRPFAPLTVPVRHIFRREDGEWKIVHRHGEVEPVDQGAAQELSTD